MYNESLQGKSNHPQHRQKTTKKKHLWGTNSIKLFYEISFIKTKGGCQRLNLFLTNKLSDWSRRSTRERIMLHSYWIKITSLINIIWNIENILKNFGTSLCSLFTIKNKQTKDRFIVICRKSTCMYSACMYDATLINDRIVVTLKNQHVIAYDI